MLKSILKTTSSLNRSKVVTAKLISQSTNFSTSSKHHDALAETIQSQLDEMKSSGTYKHERIIQSAQEANIKVSNHKVLNFCSNNYLGLSNHPNLVQKAKQYLDSHGFGMSSVRFICGTQDIHKELEEKISKYHETEDSILFPSAFDANAGLFESILTSEDAVISDSLNHASIIDGIRLCKARRLRYNHLDVKDLEQKLQESQDARIRLIATDGVFSMDGDIAPLDKIVELAQKYNANLFVDECHATGFFGKNGKGTPFYFGVQDHVDIVNSTLGKALGGATGGYATGRKDVVDILRQRARPYLFSNSLAPPLVGAYIEVFNMLENGSDLIEKLQRNTKMFRTLMKKHGFKIMGNDDCPICPVYLGDAKLSSEFADEMLKRDIYVIGFSFPVVPKGHARIRVQLSAAHTEEQIQRAVDAFVEIGKSKNVI